MQDTKIMGEEEGAVRGLKMRFLPTNVFGLVYKFS
jgi:hypothetical protein